MRAPPIDRLADKFEVDHETGCWNWTAAMSAAGYGRVRVGESNKLAYRAVWEMTVEPVPDGLELDHLCRNTRCINPDHLEPVTHAENMRRSPPAQVRFCPSGHLYDDENTYWHRGHRQCRACRARRSYERRHP